MDKETKKKPRETEKKNRPGKIVKSKMGMANETAKEKEAVGEKFPPEKVGRMTREMGRYKKTGRKDLEMKMGQVQEQ